MAYSIRRDDPTVTAAIRRIADSQLSAAIASLASAEGGIHTRVHDARKRVKKLRALIRLVRPAFPDYGAENARLRDASRRVSGFRDLTAAIETCDRLAQRDPDLFGFLGRSALRGRLVRARAEAEAAPELAEKLDIFAEELRDARHRAAGWTLKKNGFEAVGPGLAMTYTRARKAMKAAARDPAPENLHEWRKRVKYHGYHARLLRKVWPEMMSPHIAAARLLGEELGEVQDLNVFVRMLEDPEMHAASGGEIEGLLIADRERLEEQALALGGFLLAEPAKPLVRRWERWWRLWRGD